MGAERRLGRAGLLLLVALTSLPLATAKDGGSKPRLLLLAGSAARPVLESARPRIEEALGVRLEIDLGGSGTLLARLELSRRGDIYLPGSHDYLERAVERGLVDPDTRRDFAFLAPALLVPKGNPRQISRLADLEHEELKAAIGDPRAVCAGDYALELLQQVGLAKRLLPRLGRARSCAALANLIALGSVDAVVGWRVFASWYPNRLEALPLLDDGLRPRLASVPGAVTAFATHPEKARAVLDWLAGKEGQQIWNDHGYFTGRAEALRWLDRTEAGGQ